MADLTPIEKLSLKAKQAIAQRDWARAKLAYLQALGLRSDMPDIHYGLATVYFQLKELTSAAHHFREVTRLDPTRAGAFINLGAVLNVLGEYDEAITVLQKGVRIDAKRAEGYYNLGLVYRRKGQLDLAIAAYREALRLNPRMGDAHLNLANIYVEKEQHKVAADHYRKALDIRPGWEKAEAGLEEVEAYLAGNEKVEVKADGSSPSLRAPADPEKLVDPNEHGQHLSALHQATADIEETGREILLVLERQVESAIKELSTCLLYRDRSRTELTECIQKFEEAMNHVRQVQQRLREKVNRIDRLAEQFPTG